MKKIKKTWPHAANLAILFPKFDWQSVDGSKESINWKIDDLMPYIDIAYDTIAKLIQNGHVVFDYTHPLNASPCTLFLLLKYDMGKEVHDRLGGYFLYYIL